MQDIEPTLGRIYKLGANKDGSPNAGMNIPKAVMRTLQWEIGDHVLMMPVHSEDRNEVHLVIAKAEITMAKFKELKKSRKKASS